jgi:type I restriction enzyme S subunit
MGRTVRVLYACVFNQAFTDYLVTREKGAAYPAVSPEDIGHAEIALPPLKEQRAIACILGTLDDKIELNRRRCKTLEAMARAIFQSWFVDFDPVKAKAAVRKEHPRWTDAQVSRAACPKLKPELAALFPDSFEDSLLGPIPKGWRVGTLREVADNPRRGINADEIKPGTPYIALEHMPRRSIALAEWTTADAIESNKFEFHQSEILFGKLRPYFHKVGVAPVDGVCSTDILVIVPKQPEWFGFCTGHFSSDAIIQHADRASTGTKMPRTNWNDLARFEVVIPQREVAKVFTKQFKPMIDRIHQSVTESLTLAALRDTLLPKLISGELRVPDAERIVGRAV